MKRIVSRNESEKWKNEKIENVENWKMEGEMKIKVKNKNSRKSEKTWNEQEMFEENDENLEIYRHRPKEQCSPWIDFYKEKLLKWKVQAIWKCNC